MRKQPFTTPASNQLKRNTPTVERPRPGHDPLIEAAALSPYRMSFAILHGRARGRSPTPTTAAWGGAPPVEVPGNSRASASKANLAVVGSKRPQRDLGPTHTFSTRER